MSCQASLPSTHGDEAGPVSPQSVGKRCVYRIQAQGVMFPVREQGADRVEVRSKAIAPQTLGLPHSNKLGELARKGLVLGFQDQRQQGC